jgi:nicotinamidase-related amidase
VTPLPLPPFADPSRAADVWRVDYRERALDAEVWVRDHGISSSAGDKRRVCLLLVDCQNTFCTPGFELFVGGRSGRGAVDDTTRICEFIYRNLGTITEIVVTLDTHRAVQIFHPFFWVDAAGRHPEAGATIITVDDVASGRWRVNPAAAPFLGRRPDWLQSHALHYVTRLAESGRYPLTVWPYHAMIGGIGHAMVSAIEEAVFFHGIARGTAPRIVVKGDNPLSEHYSVLGPEVLEDVSNLPTSPRDHDLIEHLLDFDSLVIAGQAKSHCVAWTVEDLLRATKHLGPGLAERVYLLDDCSSAVVIPGVVDYTDEANEAYGRFGAAGMNVVNSQNTEAFTRPLAPAPAKSAAAPVFNAGPLEWGGIDGGSREAAKPADGAELEEMLQRLTGPE